MIRKIKRWWLKVNINACHICWNGNLCTKHKAADERL